MNAGSGRFAAWITEQWHASLRARLATLESEGRQAEFMALQSRLEQAIVVSDEDILPGRVQFGSRVTVFSIDEEEEQTFRFVSADEAEVSRGLLAITSPLAQALIGKQEGDVVTVELESGANCDYELTHIRLP